MAEVKADFPDISPPCALVVRSTSQQKQVRWLLHVFFFSVEIGSSPAVRQTVSNHQPSTRNSAKNRIDGWGDRTDESEQRTKMGTVGFGWREYLFWTTTRELGLESPR